MKSIAEILYSLYLLLRFSRKASLREIKRESLREACYVLGNGPSLKDDLHLVSSNDTVVAVNSFALTADYERLKPAFYLLVDPAFWRVEITRPELVAIRTNVLQTIKETTDWTMHIILPVKSRKNNLIQDVFAGHEFVDVFTFNSISILGPRWFKNFFYKKTMASPRNQNVLVGAIYCAIVLGFKEIVVLGADHSWHQEIFLNEKNEVCLIDKHFYDDTDNKPTGKPWRYDNDSTFTMSEIFKALSRMFEGYDELSWFAKTKNIQVINKSSKTFIDAFPRTRSDI